MWPNQDFYTHCFHELWFIRGGIPSVVQNKDVGFGELLTYFVKEAFLLQKNFEGKQMKISSRQVHQYENQSQSDKDAFYCSHK